MKRFKLPLLTLSVLLYSASAFAQHGHVGGSMGPLSVWMGRAASAQSRGVVQPQLFDTCRNLSPRIPDAALFRAELTIPG